MKSMGLWTQLCLWVIALVLVPQLEARRSSSDFEQYHSVMYALGGAFWVHVLALMFSKLAYKMDALPLQI